MCELVYERINYECISYDYSLFILTIIHNFSWV